MYPSLLSLMGTLLQKGWAMKLIRIILALLVSAGIAVGAPALSASAAERSCSNSTPVASRPTLRYGDTGTCVKTAQQLLLNKGYSLGGYSATGNFLSFTKDAVLRFQRDKKLVQNGTVDQPTWKQLAATVSAPPAGTYSIYRGPNYTSRVILTYDDCPNSLSAFKAVVVHAKNVNVGLVLAPTGNCITSGRFDAAFARKYGHWVINHSVSHPDLRTLSYSKMLSQLSSPGVVTNYGRPPYGAYNTTVKQAYAAKGMKIWLWNVDTRDWDNKPSRATVVSRAVNGSTKGVTVLMHMQHNGFSATAINEIKAGLTKKGLYTCRTYSGTSPVKLPASLPC